LSIPAAPCLYPLSRIKAGRGWVWMVMIDPVFGVFGKNKERMFIFNLFYDSDTL